MSAKKPSMSHEKAYSLLCAQDGQLIHGVKIEWSSAYGPGAPFAGGFESKDHPVHALKAGKEYKK